MRWKIRGADRDTGDDYQGEFEADSRAEAERQARAINVLVESVTVMADVDPKLVAYASYKPLPATPRVYMPEYTAIVVGSIVLRVCAFVGYIGAVVLLALAVARYQDATGGMSIHADGFVSMELAVSFATSLYIAGASTITLMLAYLAMAIRDIARNSFHH
jgi:hypothetical protein